MGRKGYPTDLTDAQWNEIEQDVPASLDGGRPEKHPRREIVNAILYQTRAGSSWRMLPHDLPPWKTVYHYFRKWAQDGTLKQIHDHLH